MVESELELLQKFPKVRPLIDQMARAFETYAAALNHEMLVKETEAFRALRSSRVDEANAAISRMPSGPRANSAQNQDYQAAQNVRDGLARERDNAARELEGLRAQQVSEGRKEELARGFATKRETFLKAIAELKPVVDEAEGVYRKLRSDSRVAESLANLTRSTKSAVFLGPSKEYRKAVDAIKQAERAYSPATAAPKRKGRPSGR